MRTYPFLLLLLGISVQGEAQINGPMPGHADMMEATIWLQCHGPCTARLEYWASDRPDSVLTTVEQRSDPAKAHAMDLIVAPLQPGTRYGYRVVLDGLPIDLGQDLSFRTQPLWKFRTDPPTFSLTTGSCAYTNEPAFDRPGKPYGSDQGIFDVIADHQPDMMLWLGDNIYLREPDWGSRTGFLHRYTHTRSAPELQRLLRSTHHYAIWDDHDFGPNDGDGSFVHAPLAREAFDLFWPNPTNGVPGVEGITTAFSYADVDFFLMDDRTFRVPPDVITDEPAMLGKAQLDWLIRALKYSDASFKLVAVGSQVLNPAPIFENYATFIAERAELIERIEVEGITGVVFLTGDRHFTSLNALELADGRVLYDLTSSSLTAGVYPNKDVDPLLVPGTVVEAHNFSKLTFSGPAGDRTMIMEVFDAHGELRWKRSIRQHGR